jgi:hypothetical protein
MANHNLPTLASTYANFVTEMDARMDDISIGFDPAFTTVGNPNYSPSLTPPTNIITGTIRWVSSSNKWEKWSGLSWADLASTYAINISGTAAAATQLAASKNINGVPFNGSDNISINLVNALTINNAGLGVASDSTFNGSAAITISYNSVGAPSVSGANATGTWEISITGNAATATTASSVTNGVYTTGDQSISGVKTFSNRIVGKTGGSNTTPSISVPTTGGSFASMYTTRRGTPYHTSVVHTGSSYAPSLGIQYEYTGTYLGIYSLGHLALGGSNPGAFAIHHINSANTEDRSWTFAGASGDFTSPGNVTAYSDEKLKTEWNLLPGNFLQLLANVKNGTYTRIDTKVRQVGVSAQSLKIAMPEAVVDGETLSVAYGNAALAAAVELAKEACKHKTEINMLKEQVNLLNNKLNELLAKVASN